jgi:hypothetical protein
MLYWIYDIPTAQLAILFSSFFVGFTWVGTLVVRPLLRIFVRRQQGINDLIGYILSCFCVFYGLLLGLIAVAAYQNFTDTDKTVTQEAASLVALYRDISGIAEPDRGELQDLLREYTRFVIEEDWPAQRQGNVLPGGSARIGAFMNRLVTVEPKSKAQEILLAETLRAFNQLSALRRMRVFSVTTGIPAIMWYVVVVGAFLTILLVWLLDMKLTVHLFLGGLLSFFIGTVIVLIAAMDNPYRGEVSIGPDAFENVYKDLMKPKISLSR